jgi:hypothetical protein
VSQSGADALVLDVRTYKLVAGGRNDFDRLFRESALPMLRRFGIDVVGYGPSVDDDDNYYLIRSFASAALRDKQLGSFYGSDEWRQNFRRPRWRSSRPTTSS